MALDARALGRPARLGAGIVRRYLEVVDGLDAARREARAAETVLDADSREETWARTRMGAITFALLGIAFVATVPLSREIGAVSALAALVILGALFALAASAGRIQGRGA